MLPLQKSGRSHTLCCFDRALLLCDRTTLLHLRTKRHDERVGERSGGGEAKWAICCFEYVDFWKPCGWIILWDGECLKNMFYTLNYYLNAFHINGNCSNCQLITLSSLTRATQDPLMSSLQELTATKFGRVCVFLFPSRSLNWPITKIVSI